ncbi:MAG: DUF1801 domain-containing protein [Pseudomonadota bacterium]
MGAAKTVSNDANVTAFLDTVEPAAKKADAARLDALFRDVTGFEPVMFGPSIIGYGRYQYTYQRGHSGVSLATGFSPRKAKHSLYIMPGYADFGGILARLGKHKMGKACLYVNKLADIDEDVLAELIRAGLDDLATRWTIEPT